MRGGAREAQGQGGQVRGRESVLAFVPKSTYSFRSERSQPLTWKFRALKGLVVLT